MLRCRPPAHEPSTLEEDCVLARPQLLSEWCYGTVELEIEVSLQIFHAQSRFRYQWFVSQVATIRIAAHVAHKAGLGVNRKRRVRSLYNKVVAYACQTHRAVQFYHPEPR